MKIFYAFAALLLCCCPGFSQVGINTDKPNAQLDIKSSNPASPSNTDGILIPNIDIFPAKKPGAEQNGMMVYLAKANEGNEPGFYFWDNDAMQWRNLGSPVGNGQRNPITGLTGPTWLTGGNSGVTATYFLGTTDNADVVFKRNNIVAGRLGAMNTAFGNGTMLSQGIQNTAFGTNALAVSGANSADNTAIGMNAMSQNNNGYGNVAVGGASLKNNTTGNANVAVGSIALGANTSGASNTGVGSGALDENTTGSANLAVGASTLGKNTTGFYNVAVGPLAAGQLLTGSQNVAVGYSALYYNQSGTGNIAIGSYAGMDELGSNKLFVHSGYTTEPLIYGEFDNRLMRFNTQLLKVHTVGTTANEMLIKNSNKFKHSTDLNLNFGAGGNDFMVASNEGVNETGGIRGDGDNITIWSPGDGNRLVRFVDEDNWSDNNGNPYDAGAEKAYIDANGQYFQVSDRNKKDNIKKIDNPLARLEKLNGYTYQFRLAPEEIAKGQKTASCSGVLAQELEMAFPEAVQKNESGEYFVDYAAVTPLLIEAAKAQQQKIDLLENRLKDLEERLNRK